MIILFAIFGYFKDLLLFMQEEHLQEIEISNLKYCLSGIFGKGAYTLNQIIEILQ